MDSDDFSGCTPAASNGAHVAPAFDDFDDEDFDLPPTPVMRFFAKAKPVRLLDGLLELSFAAGRGGDTPTEWAEEVRLALADAFPGQALNKRTEAVIAKLHAAFLGGRAQQQIDQHGGDIPPRALAFAQAKALLCRDEAHHPDELLAGRAGWDMAKCAENLCQFHDVMPAQAGRATLAAFAEENLSCRLEDVDRILWRAFRGHERREREYAWEMREAQERAQEAQEFEGVVAALFGEAE